MTWLWVRPCDQAATSGSSWVVMPVVVQRQVSGHGVRLSWSTSSCASPRRLLEELPSWVCSRFSHLENSALFLCDLVSGCCVWNTDHWFLREMTWSRAQCVCDSTWLLDEFLPALPHCSHLENWTLLLCPRIFQLILAFGCCLWSTAYWIFREPH